MIEVSFDRLKQKRLLVQVASRSFRAEGRRRKHSYRYHEHKESRKDFLKIVVVLLLKVVPVVLAAGGSKVISNGSLLK